MSSNGLLGADVPPDAAPSPWYSDWLPTRAQMLNALQLNIDSPPEPDQPMAVPKDSVLFASMRQGMGMLVVAALVAGFLPFLYNWYTASRLGTVVPLMGLAQWGNGRIIQGMPSLLGLDVVLADTARMIAGLEPAVFPGWMASGLSALGEWINSPLGWLTAWLVYGLGVLLVAKLLGAPTTLQQFYTLTSFACLPMILTGLGPIPCLGFVVSLVAILWTLAIYVVAVRSATGLSPGLAILCTLLPGAAMILLAMVTGLSILATLFAWII